MLYLFVLQSLTGHGCPAMNFKTYNQDSIFQLECIINRVVCSPIQKKLIDPSSQLIDHHYIRLFQGVSTFYQITHWVLKTESSHNLKKDFMIGSLTKVKVDIQMFKQLAKCCKQHNHMIKCMSMTCQRSEGCLLLQRSKESYKHSKRSGQYFLIKQIREGSNKCYGSMFASPYRS